MVRTFVGAHWNEDGSRVKVPVNLIGLYVSVMTRNLIADNPRVMLATDHKQFKSVLSIIEPAVNRKIRQMYLGETLQRGVLDALFSVGIIKVALATPCDSARLQWSLDGGAPFAEPIDLDDYVCDTHARDFSQCSYEGHRYRCPLDVAKQSKYFSKERKKLEAQTDPRINQEGDERVSTLGRGYLGGDNEFEDWVDLWEVYLPRHKLICTFISDDGGNPTGEPIRVQSWIGPPCGPYHKLGFGVVPGNLLPKAPVQDLLDLHEAVNATVRKIMRTQDRIKELLLYEGSAADDAARITNASDGEGVKVDNIDRIKPAVFSGQHVQTLQAAVLIFKSMFDLIGGNLELLGGRGAQADTATQEKMLNQNAGAGVADLAQKANMWAESVCSALCWYMHHDPRRTLKSSYSPPGLPGMGILRQAPPERRAQVPWSEMDVRLDVYSIQPRTPATRLAFLRAVVQEMAPLMPLLQQQGIAFDANAYLEKIAKYGDEPDVADLFTVRDPVAPQQGGDQGGEAPSIPNPNKGEYVRRNVPSRSNAGDAMMLQNKLLNNNPGGAPQTAGAY